MADREWNAIRVEYVTGDTGLTELSEKHNIPLRTMKE